MHTGKKLYIVDELSRSPNGNKMAAWFLKAGDTTVHIRLTARDNETREFQEARKSDTELVKVKAFILDVMSKDLKKNPGS